MPKSVQPVGVLGIIGLEPIIMVPKTIALPFGYIPDGPPSGGLGGPLRGSWFWGGPPFICFVIFTRLEDPALKKLIKERRKEN